MFYEDTIAAIATASSNGSVSIIRISGSKAVEVADSCLLLKNKSLVHSKSHTIHYGFVMDEDGKKMDEVLVLLMKGPNSYTREDVVEIQCHGGAFVCQTILDLILKKEGVRIAEPGEFTKRAFLNGRIDLSQAEAVMDLIESKSKYALESSVSQLSGIVKEKVKEIRGMIMDDVAYIEAALDDPEHISLDLFEKDFIPHLSYCMDQLNQMKKNYDNGRLIYEGIQTVIVGKPNVGKSSFLNTMLGTDRAIVTNVPGTTRDTLEENVRIGDVFLHLIDTAGIHETMDEVEKIGIEKARKHLEHCDFCILILDSSREIEEEDIQLLKEIESKKAVILYNKSDLNNKIDFNEVMKLTSKKIISFSAKTGDGLDELQQYIQQQFYLNEISFNQEIYLSNERQKQAVSEAYDSLLRVKESYDLNLGEDFYTIDLMNAYEQLGSIIGETVDDDLVDTIFRKFCMGK